MWYSNGKKHRVDDPAVIYYKDGEISKEEYWVCGVKQRKEKKTLFSLLRFFQNNDYKPIQKDD